MMGFTQLLSWVMLVQLPQLWEIFILQPHQLLARKLLASLLWVYAHRWRCITYIQVTSEIQIYWATARFWMNISNTARMNISTKIFNWKLKDFNRLTIMWSCLTGAGTPTIETINWLFEECKKQWHRYQLRIYLQSRHMTVATIDQSSSVVYSSSDGLLSSSS